MGLRIHNDIWIKELFDKVVDKIMDSLNACASHDNLKFVQYVYVNGGFGDSQYLQKRLHEEFNDFTKYKFDVIVAKNPSLSVLNGAMKCVKEESIRYKITKKKKKKDMIQRPTLASTEKVI